MHGNIAELLLRFLKKKKRKEKETGTSLAMCGAVGINS